MKEPLSHQDYPYGFTLRCQKKVWIETHPAGQRTVEMTQQPKRPGSWNTPKNHIRLTVWHLHG
jgi:hypothetical protein